MAGGGQSTILTADADSDASRSRRGPALPAARRYLRLYGGSLNLKMLLHRGQAVRQTVGSIRELGSQSMRSHRYRPNVDIGLVERATPGQH
jgi:hypothetical protein